MINGDTQTNTFCGIRCIEAVDCDISVSFSLVSSGQDGEYDVNRFWDSFQNFNQIDGFTCIYQTHLAK